MKQVENGAEIAVTLHGRIIARLVPGADEDPRTGALRRLKALRGRMVLGDVDASLAEAWSGDDDHL